MQNSSLPLILLLLLGFCFSRFLPFLRVFEKLVLFRFQCWPFLVTLWTYGDGKVRWPLFNPKGVCSCYWLIHFCGFAVLLFFLVKNNNCLHLLLGPEIGQSGPEWEDDYYDDWLEACSMLISCFRLILISPSGLELFLSSIVLWVCLVS